MARSKPDTGSEWVRKQKMLKKSIKDLRVLVRQKWPTLKWTVSEAHYQRGTDPTNYRRLTRVAAVGTLCKGRDRELTIRIACDDYFGGNGVPPAPWRMSVWNGRPSRHLGRGRYEALPAALRLGDHNVTTLVNHFQFRAMAYLGELGLMISKVSLLAETSALDAAREP